MFVQAGGRGAGWGRAQQALCNPGVLLAEDVQGCSRQPCHSQRGEHCSFCPAGVLLCSLYELIFPLWVLAPSPFTSSASPAPRDPAMCR